MHILSMENVCGSQHHSRLKGCKQQMKGIIHIPVKAIYFNCSRGSERKFYPFHFFIARLVFGGGEKMEGDAESLCTKHHCFYILASKGENCMQCHFPQALIVGKSILGTV